MGNINERLSQIANISNQKYNIEKKRVEDEPSTLERLVATPLNIVGQVGSGLLQGLEGIVDFGAGIIGEVGGLIDKGFKYDVGEFIQKDYANEIFDPTETWAYENAYRNDFFDGVAQSIGNMLPSIALSYVTGGSSTVAMASFGASASGSGTERALQEGANYDRALAYGLLSGAKEVATEYIGGKVLGTVLGTGNKIFGVISTGSAATSAVAKTTGRTLVKQFVKDAVEEGAEEAMGDLIEPLIQQVYKDGTYGELFQENGGVQTLLEDFAAGAITGGVMGGVQMGVGISQYGTEGYMLMQDIQNINNS